MTGPLHHDEGDIILGTAGHIDHGKTALVKALTGTDTDRLPDEKRRGITIDLGFAHISEGNRRISVIDVPGHERFVRNMLAGAGGFDMALLVVAADDGVMPQTREHLEILELLGIENGIVAMTKCDLANESWQDLVEEDIREHLKNTRIADAPVFRVSVVSGQGVEALKGEIVAAAARFRRRKQASPFRMSVDRVFVKPGQGVVVTGSVGAGVVRQGDEVEVFPGGEIARIRSLQVHGKSTDSATTGQRLALNLTGVKGDTIARGAEIAAPGFLKPSRVLGVRLRPAKNATDPFRNRAEFECHIGTAQVRARLVLPPEDVLDADDATIGLLVLAEPVAAVHGRPFVLRTLSPPRTVGGGHVIQPAARIVRRRDIATWRAIARLDAPDLDDRLEAWMTLARSGPPDPLTAVRELAMTADEVATADASLAGQGRSLVISAAGGQARYALPRASVDAILDRLSRQMSRYHATHPRLTGMPVAVLVGRLPDLPRDLVRGVIDHTLARPHLKLKNDMVSGAGFTPRLTKAELKLLETLRQEYQARGLMPRLTGELADAVKVPEATLVELARILVAESVVEEIGGGIFLAVPTCDHIRESVRGWFAEHPTMTVAELRDILGISRKYAVPLAEWLDRSGLTRREGDLRYLITVNDTPANETVPQT
ncbi:selenocysteine-specific translation elongation factor [bacterium]|nr:selenocysteine-specific translation elongation factor [bacterium]